MGKIEVRDLSKSYGAISVIPELNLVVEDGEFCVLVGPSGCGKSTLLRSIAGLEEIDCGQIEIEGCRVESKPPKDRDIAMVFQNYALYPTMTVFQNMSFALRLRRYPKDVVEQKVHEAADILGMRELLDRFPKELSGGQRQRVAMGRAIVRDPQAFLFDEPLSNLDAKLRASMRGEIKSLHQRLGTTTIYVTHDQIEAMTMADKIVVLRSGRIEQIGTPAEIYREPINQFVAGFIGSPPMNFLLGRLEKSDDASAFITKSGGRIAITGGAAPESPQSLTLGIRPESLRLMTQSSGSSDDWVVSLVEPMGAIALIKLESREDVVAVTVNANDLPKLGDYATLSVERSEMHFFDEHEMRLKI